MDLHIVMDSVFKWSWGTNLTSLRVLSLCQDLSCVPAATMSVVDDVVLFKYNRDQFIALLKQLHATVISLLLARLNTSCAMFQSQSLC